MRNDSRGDVWKVWLYAAALVLLGAWSAPLLYNAGKALAEVSSNKITNGFIKWLADRCRLAGFPDFYLAAMILAGLVLFLPWMEWIHARRGVALQGPGPWHLRLPYGARMATRGQPLKKNLRGLWDACAGFMLVAGLLLSMGVALVPAGYFTMKLPQGGMLALALGVIAKTLPVAFLMEVFFRGIVMGIFLRAMRPAAALGWSAAFFALVISFSSPSGLNVVDPEAGGTGFELLKLLAARFADWRGILGSFAPLLTLGSVLAYARWRTASLWLPVGLHTGWLSAKAILGQLSIATASDSALAGQILQQGLIPLLAVIIAGLLAHHITFSPEDESPALS